MDNIKFNSSDSSTFHNQIVYKRATSYIKGNELNFIEKQKKKNDNNKIEKKKTESICSNVAPVTNIQTLFNNKDKYCSTFNKTQTRV